MAANSTLFESLQLGRMDLSSRIAMAPLTRYKASDDHVHGKIAVDYYSQRASIPGTLLITEATTISARAGNQKNVPGIYTDSQILAWKKVADAIHAKGSYIYMQLWALGRSATPELLQKEAGLPVKSSSAVRMEDDAPLPEELTEDEIWGLVGDFAQAAKNAVEKAGFDGVEIHGANGYLIDQFTQDTCNKRTDQWGGSIENRSRFGLEVTKAVVHAIGADRVGFRTSPWSSFQGMGMEDPVPQFTHLVKELSKLNLSYLHVVEPRVTGNVDCDSSESVQFVVEAWNHTSPVLLAGGFTAETARHAVDVEYKGTEIVIVFGRHFISNPDLVYRIKEGIDFNQYNRDTFYIPQSAKGYTDYPFSEQYVTKVKRQEGVA